MANRFKHAFGSCWLHLARPDYVSSCCGKRVPHQRPDDHFPRDRWWHSVIMFENTHRGRNCHPALVFLIHYTLRLEFMMEKQNKRHIFVGMKRTQVASKWICFHFSPDHHIPHLLGRAAESTEPLAPSPPLSCRKLNQDQQELLFSGSSS